MYSIDTSSPASKAFTDKERWAIQKGVRERKAAREKAKADAERRKKIKKAKADRKKRKDRENPFTPRAVA